MGKNSERIEKIDDATPNDANPTNDIRSNGFAAKKFNADAADGFNGADAEIRLDDFDDPRLRPYRNLRERTLRGESLFIAEGPLVVERLLRSSFAVESILTTRSASEFDAFRKLVPNGVPIYRIDERAALEKIVGFDFYQGILAVGKRSPTPTFLDGLNRFFATEPSKKLEKTNGTNAKNERRGAWVVLPDATKPDNLGLVFRCAAALGAEAVVLGERCCDPFSRRALRVSMGGVLQTPIYRAENFLAETKKARERWNLRFFATVLDAEASSLPDVSDWPERCAFVFGNEYSGLTPEQIAVCDQKITIPIRPDVDSLNLGVSVGIFLYEFNRNRRLAARRAR